MKTRLRLNIRREKQQQVCVDRKLTIVHQIVSYSYVICPTLTSIFCFMGTAGYSVAPMVNYTHRWCVNSVAGYALKQHCLVAMATTPPRECMNFGTQPVNASCRSRRRHRSARACVCVHVTVSEPVLSVDSTDPKS